MRVTDTLCDRCGRGNASDSGMIVGRRCDAAGSMENVTLDADLCTDCKAAFFTDMLAALPREITEDYLRGRRGLANGPRKGGLLFQEH